MFFLGSFGIALASLVIMDLTVLANLLHAHRVSSLALGGWLAGWLAGNQTKTPSKRNISLSVAELKDPRWYYANVFL